MSSEPTNNHQPTLFQSFELPHITTQHFLFLSFICSILLRRISRNAHFTFFRTPMLKIFWIFSQHPVSYLLWNIQSDCVMLVASEAPPDWRLTTLDLNCTSLLWLQADLWTPPEPDTSRLRRLSPTHWRPDWQWLSMSQTAPLLDISSLSLVQSFGVMKYFHDVASFLSVIKNQGGHPKPTIRGNCYLSMVLDSIRIGVASVH